MENFKAGDLIRNKKPYSGEAAKLIVDIDETQVYSIEGPNRFGYFDFPKHREIHFKYSMKYYQKVGLFTVLYLTTRGWIYRRFKN